MDAARRRRAGPPIVTGHESGHAAPTEQAEAALARVASRQAGVFRRRDAYAAGFSRAQVRGRLERGRWRRLRHGVFVDAQTAAAASGTPRQHALAVAAARLALDGDPIASHASAAQLHGIALLSPPPPARVALTREHGQHLSSPLLEVHAAALSAHERVHRHGVPVTSPTRTVVDLARTLPFRDAVAAADSALHRESTTAAELTAMLGRCSRWPGARRAGTVVAFADGRAESPLESVSRVLFHEEGIEPPELQQWICDAHGQPIGRVDFLWRERRTIGEADGLVKYGDRAALRAEKLRQEALERAGFVVVRWTWADVVRHPRPTAARIRGAFGRAEQLSWSC